jgi:putative transposase
LARQAAELVRGRAAFSVLGRAAAQTYSRYVVGWLLADAECKLLAEKLLADTIAKQNINRNQLTIHADNGSSMASKPVAFLLADLGVTKSHSRPHTCLLTG